MKKLKEETIINFAIAYIKSYKSEKKIKKGKPFRELPDADYISTDAEAEEAFKAYYDANAPIYLAVVLWNNLENVLDSKCMV